MSERDATGPFRSASVEEIARPVPGSIKIGPFGSQLKREDLSVEGYKVYGQENIIAGEFSSGDRRVSPARFSSLRSCRLYPGDLVMTMMGTIGRCALFPEDAEVGIMDSHLLRIQLDSRLADSRYVLHVLSSAAVVGGQIDRMSHGSIMSGLSSSIVRRLRLPLPSVAEQVRIAQILDTIDEAIQKTEQLIAKLQAMKQGLLHDLLTRGQDKHGKLRPHPDDTPALYKESPIGRIPREWESACLGDFVDPMRPIVYGILMPGYGYPGGVPVIKVKDISHGVVNETDLLLTSPRIDDEYHRSKVEQGDLLFTIRGTVGRMAFVPGTLEGANITQDTARVAVSKGAADFVRQALELQVARQFIEIHTIGQAVKGINLRDVRRIPLPRPPVEEQKTIGVVLGANDARISLETSHLIQLSKTKAGLMHDLLTGKVRVCKS